MSDATPAAPAAPEAPATPEFVPAAEAAPPTNPTQTPDTPRDDKGRFLTREERKAAAVAKLKAEAQPPAAASAAAPADSAAAPPAEPPKPPEEKKPDAMSAKVAELVRREREAQKAEAAFKAREAALKEKEAKLAEWEGFVGKAKDDPAAAFALLERAGLSYEALTDAVLNGKAPKAEDKVAAAVKAAEEKVAALQKRLEEKEAAEAAEVGRRQAEAYFKAGEEKVKAAPEKYRLTLALEEGLDTARALVIERAKQGEVIPFEAACAEVEAQLAKEAERWQRVLTPQSGTPTVSATGGSATPPESAAPQAASDVGPKTTAPRTLSNAQAAAPPPLPAGKQRPETLEERKARARAALRARG